MPGFDTALAQAVEKRTGFVDGDDGRSPEPALGKGQL